MLTRALPGSSTCGFFLARPWKRLPASLGWRFAPRIEIGLMPVPGCAASWIAEGWDFSWKILCQVLRTDCALISGTRPFPQGVVMAEQTSEQSIFLQAIALPSPADRAAFLDQACQDNSELRAEVAALLGAHDRLGSPV